MNLIINASEAIREGSGHVVAIKLTSELGTGTTIRVLLVDDEPTIRNLGKRMLAKMGLDAVTAEDGMEATEIFRKNPGEFQLVILDLTMPKLDGEETFHILRKCRADIPVLVVSGFDEQEAMARFQGQPHISFIQKPFQLAQFKEKIKALLES